MCASLHVTADSQSRDLQQAATVYSVEIDFVLLHCHDNHWIFPPEGRILDPFEVHVKV